MTKKNFMEEFVEAYHNDPVRFVQEMLGATPFDYQAEFLRTLSGSERRMSVKSGHGTGKSTTASWAMLWFLLLRYPCKVGVTAPTSSQLFDAMFAELKRWVNELPKELQELLNVKSDRVELVAAPAEAWNQKRYGSSKGQTQIIVNVGDMHLDALRKVKLVQDATKTIEHSDD